MPPAPPEVINDADIDPDTGREDSVNRRQLTAILFVALLCVPSRSVAKQPASQYPETRRVDHVDTYHGVEVDDPYRWLEEDPRNSAEVAAWIESQNKVTRRYLDSTPVRKQFEQRLTELWNYERYSVPFQKAGRYFFSKNDGLQNQAVLYVADSYDGEGRVLINPNNWSEDGTVSLGGGAASDDGRLFAFKRREAGSDWSTISVIEIDNGKQLDDLLSWTRWGNIVWNAESTGFFYIRYPEPEEGQKFLSPTTNPMIYFHRLGTVQSEDQLVYRRPDEPEWSFFLQRSDDNRFLVLSIYRSTDDQNQVSLRPVDAPLDGEWTVLVDDFENEFGFLGSLDDRLYFLTDLDAPTKRVVAMPVDRPGRDHLTEIIPASDSTLSHVSLLKDAFVASYMKDVLSEVKVFNHDGSPLGNVKLPSVGTARGFGGEQFDTETFYLFSSYTSPASIYRYDTSTGESKQIRAPQVKFDPSKYESRQAFYESKDGTRVPMIVSHRKGSETRWQPSDPLVWLRGIQHLASAALFGRTRSLDGNGGRRRGPNLRGGGEYGEDWHLAGKKLNKQNVFDDFIAAAEWLIAERVHRPESWRSGRQQRRAASRSGDDAAA